MAALESRHHGVVKICILYNIKKSKQYANYLHPNKIKLLRAFTGYSENSVAKSRHKLTEFRHPSEIFSDSKGVLRTEMSTIPR